MTFILNFFSSIKDPRQQGKISYPLQEIFLLLLCAVIAGADDFVSIEIYGKNKIEFLKKYLPYKNGVPTHETIGNVMSIIVPEEFQKCFLEWTQSLVKKVKGVVPIDGKTLRGSFDNTNDKASIHMVSAWASDQEIVLGQLKVDDKTNEIMAIPQLLDLIEIEESIVTIDAMGCQKDIAKKIVEKKADYVLALKENQKTLYDDVVLFLSDQKFTKEDVNKDHGRIEIRNYFVTTDIEWLQKRHPKWAKLTSIGMVESTRIIKGKKSIERRYYIASLESDVEIFSHAVRTHWGIENKLHWVLDVIFKEDLSRVRIKNAAENFSTIKKIALNLLRAEISKISIKGKRLKAGWCDQYLEKILMSS